MEGPAEKLYTLSIFDTFCPKANPFGVLDYVYEDIIIQMPQFVKRMDVFFVFSAIFARTPCKSGLYFGHVVGHLQKNIAVLKKGLDKHKVV